MTIKDLKDYLVDEAEYDSKKVESMTSYELVDAYLTWNGIIYYTNDILQVVFAAFSIDEDYYLPKM